LGFGLDAAQAMLQLKVALLFIPQPVLQNECGKVWSQQLDEASTNLSDGGDSAVVGEISPLGSLAWSWVGHPKSKGCYAVAYWTHSLPVGRAHMLARTPPAPNYARVSLQ
jgi:hypothetical protein